MREAVIVSTARTPLAKSHRGEFNITPGPTLASFAVKAAVQRAGIDPALIEDAILGCGYPEGITGRNVARQAIIRSELPLSIAGTTINRFCASGLQAIAMAAGRIVLDGAPAMIAGGARRIEALAVLADGARPVTPCGACRQRILEFASDTTRIHAGNIAGTRQSFSLADLLPESFGPDLLPRDKQG